MVGHSHFQDAIIATEGSDSSLLIYADWLEEQADKRAEEIRFYVRLRQVVVNTSTILVGVDRAALVQALTQTRSFNYQPFIQHLWLLALRYAPTESPCGLWDALPAGGMARQAIVLLELVQLRFKRFRQIQEAIKRQCRAALVDRVFDLRTQRVLDLIELRLNRPQLNLRDLSSIANGALLPHGEQWLMQEQFSNCWLLNTVRLVEQLYCEDGRPLTVREANEAFFEKLESPAGVRAANALNDFTRARM